MGGDVDGAGDVAQAFGLEDVGRRGFFTMSNTIEDVFFPLQRLYCEMDGAAVTHVLSKSLPMFVQVRPTTHLRRVGIFSPIG